MGIVPGGLGMSGATPNLFTSWTESRRAKRSNPTAHCGRVRKIGRPILQSYLGL